MRRARKRRTNIVMYMTKSHADLDSSNIEETL